MQEAPRRTAQVEFLRGALSATLAPNNEPRSHTHLDDIFAEQERVVEVSQRGGLFRPFDLAVRFGALSTQDDQRALDAGGSQASRPASLEDAFEQENVAQSSKSRTAVKCVKASLAGFRVVVKELKDAWGQDPVKALCREYLRTSRKSRKAGFSVFSWRKR